MNFCFSHQKLSDFPKPGRILLFNQTLQARPERTNKSGYIYTLDYPINREKLIAVHNMEHPQKVNSQEANNCLFLDIFYLF